MAADPFYAQCCITGIPATDQKVEWHHNLITAGSQVQERWCILPILEKIHEKANNRRVRLVLDWVMLNRATDEELRQHSKVIPMIRRREVLNKKFGGPWAPGAKYFQITDSGTISTQRTSQQNRAMHLFFEMLATNLNDAGLDMRKVLKPEISIPWTKQSIKDQLWRPIQEAMYSKHSTTDLLKQEEIDAIHATLTRHLAEKFHLEHIPFPSYARGYMDSAPLKSDPARYSGKSTAPRGDA